MFTFTSGISECTCALLKFTVQFIAVIIVDCSPAFSVYTVGYTDQLCMEEREDI